MDRPVTSLFLLMSLDGKILTGDVDERDFDRDLPKVDGVREGLRQYYDLEKQTDLWSLKPAGCWRRSESTSARVSRRRRRCRLSSSTMSRTHRSRHRVPVEVMVILHAFLKKTQRTLPREQGRRCLRYQVTHYHFITCETKRSIHHLYSEPVPFLFRFWHLDGEV